MILRIVIASLVGGFYVAFEAFATHYEDFLTPTAAMISGTFLSGMASLVISLLFLPIPLTRAWERWCRMWWLPCVTFAAGVLLTIFARLPFNVQEVVDPEFGGLVVYTAHPWYAFAGWLTMVLSITVCPLLGISTSRRWI